MYAQGSTGAEQPGLARIREISATLQARVLAGDIPTDDEMRGYMREILILGIAMKVEVSPQINAFKMLITLNPDKGSKGKSAELLRELMSGRKTA